MQKLNYSIDINAPKEKVWDTMISDATYREWTAPFNKGGSYFEGSWDKGSKMLFIGSDEQGKLGGMVAMIEENKPYEFISIKHVGVLKDGAEDLTSYETKKWAGAHENYTFKEENGVTSLIIDTDTVEEFKEYFNETWPKALQKLKELAEK